MIRSQPVLIQLFRPQELVPDGFGGFTPAGEPTTLEAKERYFPSIADPVVFGTEEQKGENFFITHLLIGRYDDDIQIGDFFFLNEEKYIVATVDPNRSYQVKATVGVSRRVFVP